MRRVRARGLAAALTMALMAGLMVAGPATADEFIKARLQGYNEVAAVSTSGIAEFRGKISRDESTIEYVLSYEGLEGTVTQSHIHFGQRGVNGGISVWLCQTTTNPAPGAVSSQTPVCPAPSGTVEGTITLESVIGPAGQGIAAKELAELIKAIRAGVAYVNVHSSLVPTGEIRGQLRASRGHHDDWD